LFTVIVAGIEADRLAPSVTSKVTVALPLLPGAGVTITLHDSVVVPQPAGETATPAIGIRAALELFADTASFPVPASVIAFAGVLLGPVTAALANPVNVGAGMVLSAPIASTRPYP
jgi:hypothetical protein